jgi:hypothetical protein
MKLLKKKVEDFFEQNVEESYKSKLRKMEAAKGEIESFMNSLLQPEEEAE